MSLRVFVIACVLVIVAATNSRAYAQERPSEQPGGIKSETLDEQVAKTLAAKRGVVLIDAVASCGMPTITVGRMVDGKMQRLSAIGSASFFGKRTKYGAILLLVPGEFLVLSVSCPSGASRTVLNGPFAKFTVAAGEFVDVGVLKLDYKTEGFLVHTGTMHKSVVREGPEALADHKSKLASSIARLVHRPMTLVGPADIAIRGR